MNRAIDRLDNMSVQQRFYPCLLALGLFQGLPTTSSAAATATITGTVSAGEERESIAGALVVIQCSCIHTAREATTNDHGRYVFEDLPLGTYTIQVLSGQADVAKVVTIRHGTRVRADFSLPRQSFRRRVVVDQLQDRRMDTTSVTTVDVDQIKHVPVGGTDRDFTAVIDIAPTADRDPAGIRLAGTGSDESKYLVDGANISSPTFGTVGARMVQEFIATVEVKEAGYDAEFGGASGGIVAARRRSGTNKLRGEAVLRYTPRLAAPRLIMRTDEAIRTTVVNDHQAQFTLTLAGPIIKDRLFFAFGVSPGGSTDGMTQAFYHRVDKDGSGGFQDCAFEPGANDCVDGESYNQTQRFAEQHFRTGAFETGYSGRVDWVVTPKHQLTISGGGGPRLARTNYRQAAGSQPSTFGANPATLLGGAAVVSSGVVNRHFGTTLSNATQVGLGYQGRVARDTLEIDAGISFYQSRYQQAWTLDHPQLREQPMVSESGNAKNLFEYLDRDGAVGLVSGVDEACNRPDLGGIACPTRNWLSGGLGQFNHDKSRRYEGRLSLTHFFELASTVHQLKYGTVVEHIERDLISTFSGANQPDFYSNCEGLGGGEYCYDPQTDTYTFNLHSRVNNNRLVEINSSTPNLRMTTGFGRTRIEQRDLRALATAQGSGIRATNYQSVLATQNYALFVQDRMQLLSTVYLSAGIRWELQDMRDINGDRAVLIWDNVGPRVGITYDWTDAGKSRLFASYGWLFRPLPLTLNSRVFGGLVNVTRSYRAQDCRGTVNIDGQTQVKSIDDLPTEYCVDYDVQTTGLTYGSVVPRLRGQFNKQFQVGYEQEVVEDLVAGVTWIHNSLGRAVEDISVDGGNNFIIANPGETVATADIAAKQAQCVALETALAGLDPDDEQQTQLSRDLSRCQSLVSAFTQAGRMFDRPSRNYDAWTARLRKRFARHWLLAASYTYARHVGNYDGSVDAATGAINLGASRQYDIPEAVRNSFGPLSNDRPHTVKLDGYYQFDLREAGRLTLGSSFRYRSGTPVSMYASSLSGYSIHLLPRGSGGRTPPYHQTNLMLGYAYPLPGELEIEFSARLVNLTNAKTTLQVSESYTGANARGVAGGDLKDLKHARQQNPSEPTTFFQPTIVPRSASFSLEASFQQPLGAQFELRMRF